MENASKIPEQDVILKLRWQKHVSHIGLSTEELKFLKIKCRNSKWLDISCRNKTCIHHVYNTIKNMSFQPYVIFTQFWFQSPVWCQCKLSFRKLNGLILLLVNRIELLWILYVEPYVLFYKMFCPVVHTMIVNLHKYLIVCESWFNKG